MAQDLRDLFDNKDMVKPMPPMSQGHEDRFLKRLESELPNDMRRPSFNLFSIAASVIVLLGLAYGAFTMFPGTNPDTKMGNGTTLKSLGDVSPDLKKVEDYYLASINLELSKLELTPENKDLIDGYMVRLKELNDEYDRLTLEWNDNGLNEKTLDALIDNLKFRLNLIMRLKNQLQEFNEDAFREESI
ncbi:hypothetical protein J4050_08150 [Winogradskyella sp. DF17]|uniref:Uncharacterized protein n=1 Tax=Winogradskyella pelagia TaxID=2819984 RepID=A0ABS3T1U1_9FLAO|nr:hypothetical protein [Winogradskyella sp. DF17]MBO3116714.1 hypothetical protein [Winogradskyella sp. DF17]